MKKTTFTATAVILIVVALAFTCLSCANSVPENYIEKCEAVFIYGDISITYEMTEEDSKSFAEIIAGEPLYNDNPSCGFTENVSVVVNGKDHFCIACDGCEIVYWKEKDRYISVSEEEMKVLHEILEKYGFVFPCV